MSDTLNLSPSKPGMKQSVIGVIAIASLALIGLNGCATTEAAPAAVPQTNSAVSYVALDPTLARILHRDLIVAHNDVWIVGNRLQLEVHLENRSNTAIDLHVQTFFQDTSGRRVNDQTPRTIVRVPLHGTAVYEATSISELAERAEVHLSYLRTEQVRGAPQR